MSSVVYYESNPKILFKNQAIICSKKQNNLKNFTNMNIPSSQNKQQSNNQSSSKASDDSKNKSLQLPQFIALESTVGAVVLLATKSQSHKYLFISDLEPLIFPPIMHKQFTLFRNNKNEPLAFISWAKVNEEVEKRLLSGVMKLKPQDWNSGDRIYIIDAITSLPSTKEFLKQLQENKFKDQKVNILKPKIDDKGNVDGFMKVLLTEVLKEEKKSSD